MNPKTRIATRDCFLDHLTLTEFYLSRSSLGYRYLILEKMQSPLSALVPTLIKRGETSSVSFGPIAQQLLRCVQVIHERKHVVVDIKQDNFMLSPGTGKGSSLETKLASRIRLLDLALVQPWASMDGHRTNDGGKGLAGTPLYASLNVHAGETVSRRDDLEALGYVMAELIMQIASGNTSLQLPWSNGQSDEEIGSLKAAHVNNVKSAFYKQLGSASKTFQEYLTSVREYSFKKNPDYEHLAAVLSRIKITCTKTATPRVVGSASLKRTTHSLTSKPSSKRSTPSSVSAHLVSGQTGRVTRSRTRSTDDLNFESPPKLAHDSSLMETEQSQTTQMYAAAMNDESSDDDLMEWEAVADENAAPDSESKPKIVRGLTLVVESGPEKGRAVNLTQGRAERFIIGRNPVPKNGESILDLSRDSLVDDSHAKIELWSTKKLIAVNVTDLKSSSGTFHGHEKIRTSMKVFSGGVIKVGGTTLKVVELDAAKVATTPFEAQAGKKRAIRRMVAEPEQHEVATEVEGWLDDGSTKKPCKKREGLKLKVINGPNVGDLFEIELGVSDIVMVGSKPSGKGSKIALTKDSSLKPNHIQLKLYSYARKHFGLIVTDKNTGAVKINGNNINQTGRASVNDCITIGNSVLKVLGPL